LPRRKLDPLGIDSEVDSVKLTANNKANVCAAVQRAYDRARELLSAVISSDVTSPSAAAVAAAAATQQTAAACDDTAHAD